MLTAVCLIAWTAVLICWNIRAEKVPAPQLIDRRTAVNPDSKILAGKPTDSGL